MGLPISFVISSASTVSFSSMSACHFFSTAERS